MARTWTDLHQATLLVDAAKMRLTAQRSALSTSAALHVTDIEKFEECADLLATAIQHMEDVRRSVMAGRGDGVTIS